MILDFLYTHVSVCTVVVSDQILESESLLNIMQQCTLVGWLSSYCAKLGRKEPTLPDPTLVVGAPGMGRVRRGWGPGGAPEGG